MAIEPVTIHVDYAPPLDWSFFLGYLGSRRTVGVETVDQECYCRAIEIGGETGTVSVSHHPRLAQLVVTIRGRVRKHAQTVCKRLRRMFDLDLDPSTIRSVLGTDPWIGSLLAARPGIRVPGSWSSFELLVRTIVGQQVSVRAATTIMGRIARRLGRTVDSPDGGNPLLLFPAPAVLAEANLEAIGMPSRRVSALRNVARAIADKVIPFPDGNRTPNGVKEALPGLPGIGPWTVEYFALRGLRDADAWPGTDLLLRRWVERNSPKRAGRCVSDGWRPFRAYAAMLLWQQASATTSPDSTERQTSNDDEDQCRRATRPGRE